MIVEFMSLNVQQVALHQQKSLGPGMMLLSIVMMGCTSQHRHSLIEPAQCMKMYS